MTIKTFQAASRNQQMQELSKFIHYYTRFKNHQNSLKLEEPLLNNAREKMKALANSLPSQEKQGRGNYIFILFENIIMLKWECRSRKNFT